MGQRQGRNRFTHFARLISAAVAVGAYAGAARAATIDTWTGATNGTWDTGTANWSNGGSNVYADGDTAQFPDTGASNLGITVQAGGVSPASVNFTDAGSGTNAYTFGGGSINGSGAVSLNSGFGGSVRFNAANGYSGGTTVSGGTLTLGINGALGSGSLTLGGGTLNNAAAVTLTNSIVVSGSGNAIQTGSGNNFTLSGGLSGSGALTLGNSNNNNSVFVGVTNTMTGGTITLANNTNAVRFSTGSAGNAAVAWVFNNTTANRETLDFTTDTIAFGSMTGGGVIQGNNATGTKTISAGALGLNDLFSGTIANGAGTVALTKVGTGTMTLSGTGNSYTGPTAVNAGALGVTGALTGSAVTVAPGGTGVTVSTLTGTGNGSTTGLLSQLLTVGAGGHVNPGTANSTIGRLTLNGGLTATTPTSNLDFDLGSLAGAPGTAGTNYDAITAAAGTASDSISGSVFNISNDTADGGIVTGTYHLIHYLGSTDPTLAGEQLNLPPGVAGTLSVDSVNKNVDLLITATPEPASLGLLALGATALLARHPRRRRTSR